jgi:hypothetical protein
MLNFTSDPMFAILSIAEDQSEQLVLEVSDKFLLLAFLVGDM